MSRTEAYKRNYLINVVVRADFIGQVARIAKTLSEELTDSIMEEFPIAEPRTVHGVGIKIGPDQSAQKLDQTRQVQWVFHSKDRTKQLIVAQDFITLEVKNYYSYSTLRDTFTKILGKFTEEYPEARCRRLGLRYINKISLNKGDPLDWSEYINEKMLSGIYLFESRERLCRAFSLACFNFEDFIVNYQYGIHNEDFPAVVRKKSFILDIDAYHDGPQEMHQMTISLDVYHEKIEELFEASITDALRGEMNG